MTVTVVWCVFFNRGLLGKLKYRALKYGYRAPSLFAGKMRDAGHDIQSVVCDEKLELKHFQMDRVHENATIFYISTHGIFDPSGYRACLNAVDWSPAVTGSGSNKTAVAVFDTCFLIDSTLAWQAMWAKANPGHSLRLMLGFDNVAAGGRGDALRGYAFAENLVKGQTFVDAWFAAVASTTPVYNKAVAIGIGDSAVDAVHVLDTASLAAVPGPRSGPAPHFELRP
jgi:hypothetical protein